MRHPESGEGWVAGALVFNRPQGVYVQSRAGKPLTTYFPDITPRRPPPRTARRSAAAMILLRRDRRRTTEIAVDRADASEVHHRAVGRSGTDDAGHVGAAVGGEEHRAAAVAGLHDQVVPLPAPDCCRSTPDTGSCRPAAPGFATVCGRSGRTPPDEAARRPCHLLLVNAVCPAVASRK
jgi:hypothetical protein